MTSDYISKKAQSSGAVMTRETRPCFMKTEQYEQEMTLAAHQAATTLSHVDAVVIFS